MRWYAVTLRGTAEMTVRVLAVSPEDARLRAEDGNYEDMDDGDIHFVKHLGYTVKVKEDRPGE